MSSVEFSGALVVVYRRIHVRIYVFTSPKDRLDIRPIRPSITFNDVSVPKAIKSSPVPIVRVHDIGFGVMDG